MQHIIISPLDQFEIYDLISFKSDLLPLGSISLTNFALYLILGGFTVLLFNNIEGNLLKLKQNKTVLAKDCIYDTTHGIVKSQIDNNQGQMYFPFIYTLFLFILINNITGMVPYSFSCTSHFVFAFGLSFTIVLGTTLIGIYHHGFKIFELFVPVGCPKALLPLLVLIEFISYLARNVSLGLRLAANILSGHMLLNILSGFTYAGMIAGFFLFFASLLPLAFIILFCGLEFGIAFIQAQVFVVLSSSYIKDCLHLH